MALARLCNVFRVRSLCHQPWPPSTAIASLLSSSELIEEEKTPYYSPTRFYPARIGEIWHGRYQTATKLGYGTHSTVWLARDLQRYRWQGERFVAIKVASNRRPAGRDVDHEVDILRHISKADPRHKGWRFVRKLLDSFTIGEGDQRHACLVFEPQREPLWLYARRFIDRVIPPEILKIQLQMILHGLDYLHSECHTIHTDLKPDNIMVRIEDPSLLERDARDEHRDPLPQKHIDGRVIYLSRNNYGQISRSTGIVQIVDFDRSVSGTVPQSGCIQPDVYRAPEVILDVGYTYSADIWSLGVMLWDLLEGKELFDVVDGKTYEYDELLHLARITALLGPRPEEFAKGRRTHMFYEPDGRLLKHAPDPGFFNFESTISSMQGEEKEMFIRFVKRMIKWRPEERSTAKELLDDPWLYTSFPQEVDRSVEQPRTGHPPLTYVIHP